MFRELPLSPRSNKSLVCLGNISDWPNPIADATCLSFRCIVDAGTGSNTNRNKCAPPLFDRHTTKGNLNFFSFLAKAFRSTENSSMSIDPQMQLLSSSIGTIPRPLSPFRCCNQISSSSFLLRVLDIVTYLPFAFPSSRVSFVGVKTL